EAASRARIPYPLRVQVERAGAGPVAGAGFELHVTGTLSVADLRESLRTRQGLSKSADFHILGGSSRQPVEDKDRRSGKPLLLNEVAGLSPVTDGTGKVVAEPKCVLLLPSSSVEPAPVPEPAADT